MGMGNQIKKIRKGLGLTQKEVAERANLSRSYLADVENDRYNPSLNSVEKIAEVLNVSLDRLTGNSVSALIENQIESMSMTLEGLSKLSGVSVNYLLSIDNISPNEGDYEAVSRIANALKMNPGTLRAALARQEPPAYDGPRSTVEEDFAEIDFQEEKEPKIPAWATSKDLRDFKRMLEEDAPVMFDGVPLDQEDKEKVLKVMEAIFWDAKKRNKRK